MSARQQLKKSTPREPMMKAKTNRILLLILPLMLASFVTITHVSQAADSDALTQVKEDMAAGKYTAALAKLDPLVKTEQDNYEAWFMYGVAHVHEQQFHQAIEAFRHVIELRPTLAEPHNNLAAVYNALGDPKAAVNELEEALKKRPNYVVAEENLADLYVKLALQHYRNTLDPVEHPRVEQRYNRLLNVRNPMPSDQDKAPENNPITPVAEPVVVAALETSQVDSPATAAPEATPVVTPTADTPLPAMPEEGRTIAGVLDALEAWRAAWSAQNVDAYFDAYDVAYQPESRFASREAWKAYKTRVIRSKSYIRIKFNDVHVDMADNSVFATVTAMQDFRSNNYNNESKKKITMKFGRDGWKIFAEESI